MGQRRPWATALLQSDTQLGRDCYYEASVQRPPAQPVLQGQQRFDVLVVGGGFAGLTAALELAERGRRVCLLEADRLCAAASGRNGGQAIVGYASGQGELEQQLGPAQARQCWDWSLEAIDLLDQRIAAHGIDCDRVHGYLYVADSPRKARQLRADMAQQAEAYGLPCDWAEGADVARLIDSPRYLAAAYEQRSGHLHPLKYGLGLARAAAQAGVVMHEHSPVRRLQQGRGGVVACTDGGQVTAEVAVVAGNCTLAEHGPEVVPQVQARIMPVGTYMVATPPLDPALCQRLIPSGAAVCDNNFVLDYFRFSADHRLLFGGRVSYTTRTPSRLGERMQRRIGQVFPALADTPLDHVWGGFVDISMNRAPDFGRVGQRVYYLQGFSGHGVALTALAGRVVAEAVAGQTGRLDTFAALQHRAFPGGPRWRTPVLALGMLWYRLRDHLG